MSRKARSLPVKTYRSLRGGICAPQGFRAHGIYCGVKKKNLPDLCLIHSAVPASAAGLFTRNRVVAPPVLWTQKALRKPILQAVIANSGNANACTGREGFRAAEATASAVARTLSLSPDDVAVASTGVIGVPLPVDRIISAMPGLVRGLSVSGGARAARAIMTTDTRPKTASLEWKLGGKNVRIGGIAKGSGMIHPDMATMLAFLTTDAALSPAALRSALKTAVDHSFHRITVDGDSSTNDMVLLLANGLSKVRIHKKELISSGFQEALNRVCLHLARAIVLDGEGATKFVTVHVINGRNEKECLTVAKKIACSSLVKTALFGEDANWGRIMAAAGASGVPLQPERIDIHFDNLAIVRRGRAHKMGQARERMAARILKKKRFSITVDLHRGRSSAEIYTSDLSLDYVKINADYRS